MKTKNIKDSNIHVRVTKTQKENITEIAEERGETISDLLLKPLKKRIGLK